MYEKLQISFCSSLFYDTPVVTKVPDGGIDMQLLSLILSIVAVALSVVALIINIRANRKRKKELENERHDRSTGE